MTSAPAGFEGLMGTLDYPMFIVTTRVADHRSGCLIGFASQASIEPPRFLVGLSDKNHTFRVARGASHLAVHFVPADGGELAELFGGETGDEVDKFARCAWHDGPEGMPILDDCENWFVGRVLDRAVLGDHVGHLLEPVVAQHGTRGRQFTFHRAKRIEPGHEA
jgi:flavin reductase (DIM6/NTAB) family NADH-FMN oxidoreductase RutF